MSTKTYSQTYYSQNKERIKEYVKEKTKCECGAVVARVNMARHKRTKLHETRLKHNEYLDDVKNGIA